MALFEIILPCTDIPPPLHLAVLILILALYLALAYLTKATQGFYTYDFLDPAGPGGKGKVAGYVFGILLAIAIIYGLVCALIWARKWLTERVFHKSAIASSKTEVRNSDIEMFEESK